MRKFALFLLLMGTFLFGMPKQVHAFLQDDCGGPPASAGLLGTVLPYGTKSHTITKNFSSVPAGKYQLVIFSNKIGAARRGEANSPEFVLGQNGTYNAGFQQNGTITVNGNVVTWTFDSSVALSNDNLAPWASEDPHYVYLYRNPPIESYWVNVECPLGYYKTSKNAPSACDVFIWQERGGQQCYASGEASCLEGNIETHFEVRNIRGKDGKLFSGLGQFILGEVGGGVAADIKSREIRNGIGIGSQRINKPGSYTLSVEITDYTPGLVTYSFYQACTTIPFNTVSTCGDFCAPRGTYNQMQTPNFELCEQVANEEQFNKCQACLNGEVEGGNGRPHIWTAIGCVPTAPTGMIQTFIRLALGLGGGVTLLLILAGAFRLSVSQGDPKAAEEAKEQITSAVIGLLFVIFSVVILRFIGVQVLHIPGFGG